MRSVRRGACIAVLVVRAALAAPSPADQAFERGRTLLQQNKIAEACAAFEDSLRLDFQYGTLFNLAQCDVRRGKLATALAAFRRVAAEDKANPTRAARAQEIADELEPRVPTVRVVTGPGASPVTLDGQPVDITAPVRVDVGTHVVAGAGQRREVRAAEGERLEVTLAAPGAPPPPTAVEAPMPPPRRPSKLPAALTIGGGVLALGSGLSVGAVAWSGWRDAQKLAMTDPVAADRQVDHVRTLGNVSTALVAVGAVAIAVGVYLWRR
jgi:hypothetical protein